MKKIKFVLAALFAVALSCPQVFAEEEEASGSKLSESWKNFGKSAKDAAKSLGNAMSETGKKAGDKMSEAFNSSFYGTWVYDDGEGTTTTIKCTESDRGMEISQKTLTETDFWRGTCSGAVAIITFKVSESGTSGLLKNKSVKDNKTWRVTYSLSEDGKTMYAKCSNIPTTQSGHNFSKETAFVLQE